MYTRQRRPMSASPSEPEPLPEGTLISHLLELRDRLLRSVIAVSIAFAPLAWYQNELFTLVAKPLLDKLPAGTSLIATSVTAPFMAPLKLSLIGALFVAMPYVLYQIWAFVAPGLYKHEKRFALPLLVTSILLFYVGVAFAYFIVFPLMFTFFTSTTPVGVKMMTDISSYLDFALMLFFAFGVAFEVPVATVLLVATGLVKIATLKSNRGYVILGIFIVAAILTPPDAVSQCFMAVPMWLLYEFGIVFAQVLLRDKLKARAAADAEAAREEAAQSSK
jgi:sec-independent protein translocase protein TatC